MHNIRLRKDLLQGEHSYKLVLFSNKVKWCNLNFFLLNTWSIKKNFSLWNHGKENYFFFFVTILITVALIRFADPNLFCIVATLHFERAGKKTRLYNTGSDHY